MTKLIFATIALTAAQCANAAPRILPPVERVENVSSYFLSPKVGEVAKAEVGESLYKEGTKTLLTKYRATLKEDASSTMANGYKLSIKAGAQGVMLMRPDTKMPLLCFVTNNTGLMGFFGDSNVTGCLADINGDQVFRQSMFKEYQGYFPLEKPVPYDVKKTETLIESRDDFHVDVLYQGVSRGEVKISYREFSGGMARPAFNQDIAYELGSDGTATIGFKGMRIRVLKANSEMIEYVIDQPMPSLAKYREILIAK
ncbi:hypothetical protein O0880_14570 [Janthinobacterium sp. SUN118]|uniref:hypothetical protein n=1 Tax=Janthinobacterium sp. SUN118 TaxID=3004100 RepID=UPI0025AFDB34|nr:hypothetical protein [Janthinobacterium sp. SUN118]MDN2710646.1 hypothetical protein [Janthinobacterium sp. SUN118]